ncbi:hypothetical protein Cni_G11668 [Canna indica]|uniref:Phosphatidic acid phosphatase type 2/haloperoxidase domain-containing protein n=1 Tax=Canna indica TaxID=4628 RepID=A0AAQ3K717_9LILI|nr:hypothetical protein Cni_G11668 [Canna indica]
MPSSASFAVHFTPIKPSLHRHHHHRHRPATKNPIFTPRPGSKSFHLGRRSTLSFCRAGMTELARGAALGDRRQGTEEEGRLMGEAEAILDQEHADLVRGFSRRDVGSVLNRMSKWIVAAIIALAILFKHDAEVLWAAMGSVLNTSLSVGLKWVLNHDRPVSGLRSDPGMPSSHAQSIFYAEAFVILLMIHGMGINLFTVTVGSISLVFSSYLSWLRVSHRLHTMSQVVVGGLLGFICGVTWFWMWHSFVLRAFISYIWVRVVVVLGSATFCAAFVVYMVRHCLKEEA